MKKNLFIISALLIVLFALTEFILFPSTMNAQSSNNKNSYIGSYRYSDPNEGVTLILHLKENGRYVYNLSVSEEYYEGSYEVTRDRLGNAVKLTLLRPDSLDTGEDSIEFVIKGDLLIKEDGGESIVLKKFDEDEYKPISPDAEYLGTYEHITKTKSVTVEMSLVLRNNQQYLLSFGNIPFTGFFSERTNESGEKELILEIANGIYERDTLIAEIYEDYIILVNPFTEERLKFQKTEETNYNTDDSAMSEYKPYYGEYVYKDSIYLKINEDNTYRLDFWGTEFEATYREENRDGKIVLVLENPEEYSDSVSEIECVVGHNTLTMLDEYGDLVLTKVLQGYSEEEGGSASDNEFEEYKDEKMQPYEEEPEYVEEDYMSDETLMPPYAGFYEYYKKDMGVEMFVALELTKDNQYYLSIMGELLAGEYEVNSDDSNWKIVLQPSPDSGQDKAIELDFDFDNFTLSFVHNDNEILLESRSSHYIGTYKFNLEETQERSNTEVNPDDSEIYMLKNMTVEVDRAEYYINISGATLVKGVVHYTGQGEFKLIPAGEYAYMNTLNCKLEGNNLYVNDPADSDLTLVFDKE
jgi:hypothetical protein